MKMRRSGAWAGLGILLAAAAGAAGFPIDTGLAEQTRPAAAYNSQGEEFLVVWSTDDASTQRIYGRRVSKDGNLLGSGSGWFAISPAGGQHRNPDVAYDSGHDEYLVVWQSGDFDSGLNIQGQRISATGALVGPVLAIALGSPSDRMCLYPAVEYAATSDQYLVVWAFDAVFADPSIRARTLAWNGAAIHRGLFALASFSYTDHPDKPDLAYNPARNEFLVVWEQDSTTTGWRGIWGRRVGMTGGPGVLGTVIKDIVNVYASFYEPAVSAIPEPPGQGQYLVMAEGIELAVGSSGVGIYGRRVSHDGVPEGLTIDVSSGGTAVRTDPSVSGDESSARYLVTWTHDDAPGFTGIAGRLVTSVGDLASLETPIAPGLAQHSAVSAGPLGRFLIAYDDDGYGRDIYGTLWWPPITLPDWPPVWANWP